MTSRLIRPALAAPALFLLLSGCLGGLLGGGSDANLYRFGGGAVEAEAPATGPFAPGALRVELALPDFSPETAGDRILTTEGASASYIKDARWVTQAPVLYRAALAERFTRDTNDVPIIERRRGDTDFTLRVRIDRFQANYQAGPKQPPVFEIAGVATLFDNKGEERASYAVSDREQAMENRTLAIVDAVDRAVARQTSTIARWASGAMRQGR